MNIVFLLAAGKSTRFGKDKLFELFKDKPVILWSLEWLEKSPRVSKIFIAASTENKNLIKKLVAQEKFSKVEKIIIGGQTRFKSVSRLLAYAKKGRAETFVIHNAANPLATNEDLEACFLALKKDIKGVAVGRKITSTVKNAPGGVVKETVPREDLWEMETPQVVRAPDFIAACRKFANKDFSDDLTVLEAYGKRTAVVPASLYNRKITTPADLEMLMSLQAGCCCESFLKNPHPPRRILRGHCEPRSAERNNLVGIGEDSHRFRTNRLLRPIPSRPRNDSLVLGGVEFPKYPALEAESDGDVMIHALCNAISSALGNGSLGTYATEMRRNGIRDSSEYLKFVMTQLKREHRKISQCSFSIEAKRPLIDSEAPKIKKNLSKLLEIPPQNIGITATSGEDLTPFGRGEAIRCQALVSLRMSYRDKTRPKPQAPAFRPDVVDKKL